MVEPGPGTAGAEQEVCMTRKLVMFLSARCWPVVAAVCLLGLLCAVRGGAGQIPQPPPPSPTRPHLPGDVFGDTENPLAAPNAAKLEHMREDDRRKRLLSDTAKLVELSNELKADVEKAPKDTLSIDVVKKAAEIEKLAHDVKERMKS